MSANETQVDDLDIETFEVTDAALAKVLEVRSEEDNPESTALRVAITGSNGPEFSYDLSFEDFEEAQTDDHVYRISDLTVIIPKADLENLSGATLDLPSNPMQGGLVIRNPNRPKMLEGEDIELTGTPGEKLQQLLDLHINPSLAAHSGYGCQGCAMSAATLRQGIEVMIAEAIPEITEVIDVTDHEAGENPFFE